MFFKIKQQFSLCANVPKGALQQLFLGGFREFASGP